MNAKHWADKPILRQLFWFLVLPHQAKQWVDQRTDLEKDAGNLLLALRDAWPYVHQWSTIDSIKTRISGLMRKHGDFADVWKDFDDEKESSAIDTLRLMGYTYHGGDLWKPPLGKSPDFDLIDSLRKQIGEVSQRNKELSDWVTQPLADTIKELDDARSSLDWYKRRVDLLQQWQSNMRDPERTIVCDIIANGQTMPEGGRYNVPALDSQKAAIEVALIADARYCLDNPDVLHSPAEHRKIIEGLLSFVSDDMEEKPFAWARPDAVDVRQDFRFIKVEDFTLPLYARPERADAANKPAPIGCDHCTSPLYAGTKCKNCGRVSEPAPCTDICRNCAGQRWEPSVNNGKVPCSFCHPAPSTAGETPVEGGKQ